MALSYLAIIKDNLNELALRIDYAESRNLNADFERKISEKVRALLKSVVDDMAETL